VIGEDWSVIGIINSRKRWSEAFKKAQHAPIAFVAFNAATDVVPVGAVLRADNMLLGKLET
jgi:hypothetical protein